jgi:hypothetical protein
MESVTKEEEIPFAQNLDEEIIITTEEAGKWKPPYSPNLCGIWTQVKKIKMKNLVIGVVCKSY